MKKTYFIIGFFALIVTFGLLGVLMAKNNSRARVDNADANIANNEPLTDIKESEEGEVVVGAQLVDTDNWKFEISLNTHTTDISQDLTQVSVLVDGNGKEYKPLAWEGDPPGGHHRSGILSFGEIDPKPQKVTLAIEKVGGIEKRIFTWEL